MFRYDPATASAGKRFRYGFARAAYGEYPPDSGLNYVWESRENPAEFVVSPYTDVMVKFLKERGAAKVGQWVESLSYDPTVYTTKNYSAGLLTRYRQDFSPLRTRIITGVDFERSPGSRFEQSITTTKVGSIYTAYTVGPTIYDYDVTYLGISPYLQAETSPTEALRVTAGLRYDVLSYDYDTNLAPLATGAYRRPEDTKIDYRHTSPKLGATYELDKRHNIFAGYSHGFLAPSENQLFRQGSTVDTLGLQPVKADNYEPGLRAHPTDTAQYEISLYYLSKKDDIVAYKEDPAVPTSPT